MESKSESKKIRLGISVGDLNGIGCEVALKCFQDQRMLDFCTPIFFASNKAISEQAKTLEVAPRFMGLQTLKRFNMAK